jgi:hypothetical protein
MITYCYQTSDMGNQNSSSGSGNDCYSGHGGAVCTVGNVISGTTAMNSLTDDAGIGSQLSAAVIGQKANWACAAENITGQVPCNRPQPVQYAHENSDRIINWYESSYYSGSKDSR